MGSVALSTLRLAAQERSDNVNSTFVSNAEWLRWINSGYQRLYGLLVQKYGNDYFVAPTPLAITTASVTEFYALASDHFKLLGVDLVLAAGPPAQYITLKRFNYGERNQYMAPAFQLQGGRTNLRYRQSGNNLWLRPIPAAGLSLLVRYVPQWVPLAADSDTLATPNGWEEYVILYATILAKLKGEEDPGVEKGMLAELTRDLQAEAENRDAGAPATVVDVYADEGGYGSTAWGMY